MSMLSAQCDKLRERAAMVDGLSPALASELRMAADTIWHLRNVGSENAKLRELVEDMLDCIDIQIAFERVPARWMQDEFASRARELGIEVTDHERD